MTDTSVYQTTVQRKAGRIGALHLRRNGIALPPLSTPILYPVVAFMTSTNTNGGGIWKYLLKDVMKHNVPMLSQVLHFLDFNLTGNTIGYWREKSMRERYRDPNGPYDAPMFLDSGGFKLLYNTGISLSEFGIHKETAADDILDFQLTLGGDIIASLDYPLPPGLVRSEAETRMNRSLKNAFRVVEKLAEMENPPYLYICCHGQSREDIQDYVMQVFERLADVPSFGLAVGSLVPLRGENDSEVLSRICGVLDAIPESARDRTPIHAFGVSGNLTPILAYLGVDSLDSTSYVQAARSQSYAHPDTQKKLKILELDSMECTCRVCQETSLEEMQQAFMEPKSYRRTSTGKYKSYYYAKIALHNFEMEVKSLDNMVQAIEADNSLEALVNYAAKARGVREAVSWLVENNHEFAAKMSKMVVSFPKRITTQPTKQILSLNYTPDSFSIPLDYQPPTEKRVLLTIPCAGKKPYSLSRTHSIVNDKLRSAFGENQRFIHKITLSGLYGPVPEEFESEEAVVHYDFQLLPQNAAQIQLSADRFNTYLNQHKTHYELIIGYVTSRAYRKVLELVEKQHQDFILLPTKPKQKRLSEFFRHIHLDELIEILSNALTAN
ncbi:tRNA-guanine transglycosylase [Candidatus Poribacteria bacterium]|nr:tRNA-guanine transglycosylase [Candidatus Poribacteria bacterium]